MKPSTLRADLILLLAAVLWGGAFVAQRAAMQFMGPLTYNGIRFALGALVLVPLVMMRSRQSAGDKVWTGRREAGVLAVGCAAGLVLFIAVSLQQAGLVHTTAGKAGFITGLYMPLVPILGLILRQRTGIATWVGVCLAVVGLYFLSVPAGLSLFGGGDGVQQLNRGDALVAACAVVWAVHVLLIGRFAPRIDPLQLGLAQFVVVAIASFMAAIAVSEPISSAGIHAAIWPILYGGLISVAVAYTLQLIGQSQTGPGHAALLLSLETVFSAIAGYLVLQERLGPRELLGAAVMFMGMLVSQASRLLPKATVPMSTGSCEAAVPAGK